MSVLLAELRPEATVVSPDRTHVASFDREGRLLTYFAAGRTYKRSLASEVHLRLREGGRRVRRVLGEAEALAVFREAYGLAERAWPEAGPALRARLEAEVLRWTPERLLAERERFLKVYKPISILPPDQYFAVVLQATEGCTWNRCTFCTFYADRPFRARSLPEFRAHAEAVRAFLGRGLALRKGVFLADGNALALSLNRLVPLVETARSVFPGRSFYGFIDVFTGERHALEDWRALRAMGLERVYVGMETGLDELLAFLNKPGSRAELVRFVGELKRAGLGVGLIVMVGVGGRAYRERHARATLEALREMPLDSRDLVYVSPFVEHPASTYARLRREAGLEPMSPEEVEAELARLAAAVRHLGVRASRYDIREFVY